MRKSQKQAMSEIEQYLSRDLRQVIAEVLANSGIAPKKRLIDDIYELVMVESTDVHARSIDARLDKIISHLVH